MSTKDDVLEVSGEKDNVYEVGVHYVSSLPEEEVSKAFENLKDLLKKKGAEIISEESPKLTNLAYTMVKHVAGRNVKYSTAHFGWVKFTLSSEKVNEVKETLGESEEVLRFIIIKTVKENTLHGHKFAPVEEPKRERRSESKSIPKVAPATEAEVDKAIDELVTE